MNNVIDLSAYRASKSESLPAAQNTTPEEINVVSELTNDELLGEILLKPVPEGAYIDHLIERAANLDDATTLKDVLLFIKNGLDGKVDLSDSLHQASMHIEAAETALVDMEADEKLYPHQHSRPTIGAAATAQVIQFPKHR